MKLGNFPKLMIEMRKRSVYFVFIQGKKMTTFVF